MHANNLSPLSPFKEIALGNNCGYRIEGNCVYLNASEIFNSRDDFNISGTLTLELWALRQAYRGENFDGYALAGTQINQINGQHYLANINIKTEFQEPPAGRWQLCLMLREWNGNHFVTRDYINFNTPYQISFNPVVHSVTDNVVSLKPTTKEIETPNSTLDTEKQVTSESTQTENKTTQASSARKIDNPETQKLTSINKAKVEQLLELPGMTTKLAAIIVKSRPYKNLGDLLSVKGVGAKTFEKLKDKISL